MLAKLQRARFIYSAARRYRESETFFTAEVGNNFAISGLLSFMEAARSESTPITYTPFRSASLQNAGLRHWPQGVQHVRVSV